MSVSVAREAMQWYRKFSRFNSPYPAHDRGSAVDLYPGTDWAPSPVAGRVTTVRRFEAPTTPDTERYDYLILVDTGTVIARLLHVRPAVSAGDRVDIGDDLGTLLRSGYFAPWVENHLHLGFRDRDANPYRASGSLPVELPIEVTPRPWDGTGVVASVGETLIRLDAPIHSPGEERTGTGFGALGLDDGLTGLDGGFPHYEWGGTFDDSTGTVSLLGVDIGTATAGVISWNPVHILANGEPITGLSSVASRDPVGVKLICPDHSFEVGDFVVTDIRDRTDGNSAAASPHSIQSSRR